MCPVNWQLASSIATTFGFLFAVIGLVIVIIQLILQRRQNRLAALDALYSTLDTHEARLDREFIYHASPEHLKLQYLHENSQSANRKRVEETIASLERVAYRIKTKQIPSEDTFNLYGGVILSVAYKVWPYIQDQRQMRAKSPGTHKLQYRRYFEAVVREWARKYAKAIGTDPPSKSASTPSILEAIFKE